MITALGFLAALVAMLTGLAMLKDTHITRDDRAALRGILGRAWRAARWHGLRAVDWPELAIAMRLVLRLGVLIVITASSGVALLEAFTGPAPGPYGVLLRCALATHMAMQAPCTWIRWITRGDRRHAIPTLCTGDRGRAH